MTILGESNVKILHVSDNGLPDWRIEKSALSAKKRGDKTYFAGLRPDYSNTRIKAFDWWYNLDWDYKARYYYPNEWMTLKKQLLNIVTDCKPDFIHAHDIFAAYLVKDCNLGIPWIYDNHEYWSRSIIYQYNQNDYFKKSDPIHAHIPNDYWRKWELDIINANEIPLIVPSKRIAEELNYFNKDANVFVVPNYPSLEEIKDIPEPVEHKDILSVFTSNGKPNPGYKTPIKNIDGFFDLFDTGNLGQLNTIGWNDTSGNFIHHHGPIPHNKMYSLLTQFDIGLIPWKHHPFHPYCSPNRAYEYAHAGLIPVIPPSLETVFDDMGGRAIPLKDYKDLEAIIQSYRDAPDAILHDRFMIQEIAREHLLWENYEGNIFDAYNKAL